MKSALVLSGGGANGAYEVGVLKALLGGRSPSTGRRPLEPEHISATSIGSFNTAVLLSLYTGRWDAAVSALEDVWLDRMAAARPWAPNGVFRYRPNFLEWFDVSLFASSPMQPMRELAGDATFLARDWMARVSGFVSGSGALAYRFAELFDLSTFVTPEPSEALVRDVVSCERVRRAPVSVSMTATQWEKGTLRLFSNAEFTDEIGADIVRASGAIPGIFPAVTIDGEPYVDGGVVLNTPLKPAIDAGADELHVIYLDPKPGAVPLRPPGSTLDTIGRMFVASFAATMRRDLDVAAGVNRDISSGKQTDHRPIAIHLYHPYQDAGGALGMLDFHRDRVVSLSARGYQDTVNHDCAAAGCLNVQG